MIKDPASTKKYCPFCREWCYPEDFLLWREHRLCRECWKKKHEEYLKEKAQEAQGK